MAIRLVVVALDEEFLGRGTPLDVEVLALATLLSHHSRHGGISKLELALQSKKALRSCDQTSPCWEAHVAHFQGLDDVVFRALEIQFHFVFKRERGLCVVVDLHVQAIPEFSRGIDLHFLIKVKGQGLSVAFGDDGIFDMLEAKAKANFRRTLGPNFQLIRPENVLDRGIRDGHIGDNTRALALVSGATLRPPTLPSLGFLLAKNHLLVFRGRKILGASYGYRADVFLRHIKSRDRIIGDFGVDVRWGVQTGHGPRAGAVSHLSLSVMDEKHGHGRRKEARTEAHQS